MLRQECCLHLRRGPVDMASGDLSDLQLRLAAEPIDVSPVTFSTMPGYCLDPSSQGALGTWALHQQH